jgi:phospholipid/cholesterol/gamma-HCH transport system substrate-binding protein
VKLRKELKIGIIVAFGIAALIWGVPFLKGTDIFSNQKKVFAIYDHVDGLTASNPVQINGLKIGQVIKLSFLPDRSGRILVTMLIEGDVPIPKKSTAIIVSSDILGSKVINLKLSNNPELIENKDTLNSLFELSLAEEVTKQIAPIRSKTENLLTSMDSLITVIHKVLNAETQTNLIKSFESIKRTVGNLERATIKIDTLIGTQQSRVKGILANVESISGNLKNNNERITHILKNFSSISDTIVKANIANVINQASIAFNKINQGKGSIGLLLNNDSLYNNLSAASDNLDKLLLDMKENPKRYVHFSMFGGGGGSSKPKKEKK